MSRALKIFIIVVVDTVLIALANLFAFNFLAPFINITQGQAWLILIVNLGFYYLFGLFFRVFNRINRYTSLKELIAIFISLLLSFIMEVIWSLLVPDVYSVRYLIMVFTLDVLFISTSRVAWRILVEVKTNRDTKKNKRMENTLIIGAGVGGGIMVNTLQNASSTSKMRVRGFVDDDSNKLHAVYSGVKVLGTTQDIAKLVEEYQIEHVVIAIPSLSSENYERILDILNPLKVTISSMPSLEEIASGFVNVSKLRKVEVVDLLGRDEVRLDMDSIYTQLTGKVILVTGAGGSIGSEICRQVLSFRPKELILLGHGENSIYKIEKEIRRKLSDTTINIYPIIADVQDKERIRSVMERFKPDIVYHAAAHKHVPLMEYNPREAVKNNIFGTRNVAEAACENGVKSFVLVSTDKANNPPNVMGATKRIAEMILMGMDKTSATKFSAVRFGNVLGSRGSVVPLFEQQIKNGGPVTVTDFRMTRYFMTIPEASRLVIQSGALAKGGEVFVLDMGEPVKIVDLARKMIKLSGYSLDEITIIETGIRPGEKLYEELLVSKERSEEQVHEKIFVGNVKGFTLAEIECFLADLSMEDKELANQVVEFANQSSR